MLSKLNKRAAGFAVAQRRAFGALTSKPYQFVARPWEIRKTDTIDVTDGMGAWIQVHSKGGDVLRVNPRENDEINEEWIHDKTRFSYDGLKRQRLTSPLVRGDGQWDDTMSNWRGAFKVIASAFSNSKSKNNGKVNIRAICGSSVDLYSAVAFTDWVESISDARVESISSRGSTLGADIASQYRFNTSILGLEESDFCLLIGTNLPYEAPLLQTRLRKMFLRDSVEVMSVGMPVDITFPIAQAGLGADTVVAIAEGRHPVCAKLAAAKRPTIIVGGQVFEREDGQSLAAAIETIADLSGSLRQFDAEGNLTWNGVNVLHHAANDCGLLELGRTTPFNSQKEPTDILYLMGVNAQDLPVPIDQLVGENTFVVVQGHHGDELASRADVILPGGAFTEKGGVYVNFEGRPQKALNAVTPPVQAREDWKIFRALSEVLGGPVLSFETEPDVQKRLADLLPSMSHRNRITKASTPGELFGDQITRVSTKVMGKGLVNCTPFRPAVYDFYMDGSVIASSSQVMAKCSKELGSKKNFVEFDF